MVIDSRFRVPKTALAAALTATLAFSGCLDAPVDEPEGDEEKEPDGGAGPYVEGIRPDFVVLMNPIDATDCRNVEIVVEVPQSHADDLLPEGFEPAPGPLTGVNPALWIDAQACDSATSEEADGAYSRAWVSVLVAPPVLPEPAAGFQAGNRTDRAQADEALDFYVLAAYVNGVGFQRFLRQSGIEYEEAWVDVELESVLEGAIASLMVEEREQGDEALRSAGMVATTAESTQHRTSWAVSRHGVQAFEELHARAQGEAVQRFVGSGACLTGQQGLFAEALGLYGCNPNQFRVSQGFDVTGHSLWFHDTRVLT